MKTVRYESLFRYFILVIETDEKIRHVHFKNFKFATSNPGLIKQIESQPRFGIHLWRAGQRRSE